MATAVVAAAARTALVGRLARRAAQWQFRSNGFVGIARAGVEGSFELVNLQLVTYSRDPRRTSGYNYPEWKGSFYPPDLPAAKMLPYYAERFSTVEINYTFYRMPTAKLVTGWATQVPSIFSFHAEGAATDHPRPQAPGRRRSDTGFLRGGSRAGAAAGRAPVSAPAELQEGPLRP